MGNRFRRYLFKKICFLKIFDDLLDLEIVVIVILWFVFGIFTEVSLYVKEMFVIYKM